MKCSKVYQKLVRQDFHHRHEEKVEEHLSECPACRTIFEELVQIDQSLKEALRFEHHSEFWDDFHYGLKLRLEEKRRRPGSPRLKKLA